MTTTSRPRIEIPQGSDFTLPPVPKMQVNAVAYGDGGVGKTTLVTEYAPDPIAFINYDGRADFACKRAVGRGRRILYTRIHYPANISKIDDKEARRLGQAALDKTIKNLEIAVRESQKGNVRTIALDTGTEYGELCKLAFAGRIDKVDDYGKSKDLTNRQIWRLFHTAREGNAHLIVLGRGQPEAWVDKAPTGKFKFRGNETFIDACDWAVNIRIAKPKGRLRREFKIEMEVTKAGIVGDQFGEVYTEEEWGVLDPPNPFIWAATMNYEDSNPDDWS